MRKCTVGGCTFGTFTIPLAGGIRDPSVRFPLLSSSTHTDLEDVRPQCGLLFTLVDLTNQRRQIQLGTRVPTTPQTRYRAPTKPIWSGFPNGFGSTSVVLLLPPGGNPTPEPRFFLLPSEHLRPFMTPDWTHWSHSTTSAGFLISRATSNLMMRRDIHPVRGGPTAVKKRTSWPLQGPLSERR